MDDPRFDKTRFYRWIAMKNDEAGGVLEAKKKVRNILSVLNDK